MPALTAIPQALPTPLPSWRRAARTVCPAILGAYTVVHVLQLWPMALGGADLFNASHAVARSLAWGILAQVTVLPALLLMALDAALQWRARTTTAGVFPTSGNLLGAAFPSAVWLLGTFVTIHVLAVRWVPLFRGQLVDARFITAHLQPFLVVDLYVLGILCAALVLPLAAYRALVSRGILGAPPRRVPAAVAWTLASTLLALLALHALAAFHDVKFILP